MAESREPFPLTEEQFKSDIRVSFDRSSNKWVLEEKDQEWEWNDKVLKWIPALDEKLVEQQQRAYMVEGVDEDTNAAAENNKKRKAEIKQTASENKKAKKEVRERPNSAIYVSGIPLDAEFDEIHQVFKKYGIIEEDIHTNLPKIKMYANEDGVFKGDARIIYFRPESVSLAINMLDRSNFRAGSDGDMRVEAADFSAGKNAVQQHEVSVETIKKKRSKADRAMAIKKTEEMNAKLADWDDDDVSAVNTAPNPTKYNRMVVLKHMFTLKELEEDKAAMLEIKEEIRDEAGKYGDVTNTVLYDLEPEGIVTVRFKAPESAARCAAAFNGRFFDTRRIIAYVPEQKEQFKKSDKLGDVVVDIDEWKDSQDEEEEEEEGGEGEKEAASGNGKTSGNDDDGK